MILKPRNKLVYGFGLNDSDYNVFKYERVEGKSRVVWHCPFHQIWKHMIERCYNPSRQKKQPSYIGCTVDERFRKLMDFKAWMEVQDWEGKQIDKDILFPGNKIYGPDTCVFVSPEVNMFVVERQNQRGNSPIGVYWDSHANKYKAQISVCGRAKHLGLYTTPEDAHAAWLSYKIKLAYELAAVQTDPRVAKALIERYVNYKIT